MKLLGFNANALIMSLGSQQIRRDKDGLPTAMRIFAPGIVGLTIDGRKITGEIDAADIQSILDYHAMKGELIPLDCEHLLQRLADKKGVEEAELVKNDELLGEKAAAGFVSLFGEGGAVWANVEKLSDRARELLSSAGDKMYGYFSPVLRGIKDAPLRITSLSLTNMPALNKQDLLAANDLSADTTDIQTATQTVPDRIALVGDGGHTMEALKRLAQLLGIDVATLTDSSPTDPIITKAIEMITAQKQSETDFLSGIKAALALTDDATLESATGKILSLAEKGTIDGISLTEMGTRLADLEGKDRDNYVEVLRSEGKLTEAMLPWAQRQTTAALTDWAKTAPVLVEQKRLVDQANLAGDEDTTAMTAEDKKVAKACGLKVEAVAKVNDLTVA